MTVVLTGVLVMIIAALTGIGPNQPSITASVSSFLLDWENGNYAAAAAMTTGAQVTVASTLRDAYRQLGAQGLSLGMGRISVHGDTAVARFNASVDLGRGGRPWNYQGRFLLRRQSDGWLVQWSPSVIVPGLGAGDRLAVLTTVPGRAPLLDSGGHPLILRSPSVEVGVRPDRVKDPAVTAAGLARVTGLASSEAAQMVGQILAAPPNAFLELVQLAPRKFDHLSAALGRIPGLTHRVVTKRLFRSAVPAITGAVGTEAAKELVEDGDPYRPGTTVGLSGLEQAYQSTLAGTATTTVVVQNAAGRRVRMLKSWAGTRGTPVRTTIDGGVQRAARDSLAGLPYSASVVAIQAGTGKILAVAQRQAGGMPAVDPLSGQYQPGQAFTLVTSAAVLSTQPELRREHPGSLHGPLPSGRPAVLECPCGQQARQAAVQQGVRACLQYRLRPAVRIAESGRAGDRGPAVRHRAAVAPAAAPDRVHRRDPQARRARTSRPRRPSARATSRSARSTWPWPRGSSTPAPGISRRSSPARPRRR